MTEQCKHEWEKDLLGARCNCGRALSKEGLIERSNKYETLMRELMSLKAAYYRANTRRWNLEEDMKDGDYWMERHMDMVENGGCPVCFRDDESIGTHGHFPGCELEQLKEENEVLREYILEEVGAEHVPVSIGGELE